MLRAEVFELGILSIGFVVMIFRVMNIFGKMVYQKNNKPQTVKFDSRNNNSIDFSIANNNLDSKTDNGHLRMQSNVFSAGEGLYY